ncbi:MAG: nicotinamide mononucleotide transporter [Flavobacteriales bacterium]|nr:nicotinamide mononucleotide transporter [Flavobacteriales bacterium]
MNLSPDLAFLLEWSAVALNIGFTILIAIERRVGWLLGFVAAVFGVLLYVAQDAWLMAALNAFYAGMGAYGWWSWGRASEDQRIITFGFRMHVLLVSIALVSTVVLFFLMQHFEVPGKYHGMESFITASAMVATWMMSRKALENWFYWTLGDLVAVLYNYWLGYEGYALLNGIYIALAVAGFIRWRAKLKGQGQGQGQGQ